MPIARPSTGYAVRPPDKLNLTPHPEEMTADHKQAPTYNREASAPPLPEPAAEPKQAVERSIIRFDDTGLCGVVVERTEIWTQAFAISAAFCPFEHFPALNVPASIRGRRFLCTWIGTCDHSGESRMGPLNDPENREAYWEAIRIAGWIARPVDLFPVRVAVFVLNGRGDWIRGWA